MAEDKQDILGRLKSWVRFGRIPNDMDGREELLNDMNDAVLEIEFLRLHAGAVTRGESFADIADRVGRKARKEI